MLRRLVFLGALVYTIVYFSKASAKRADGQSDVTARSEWESEGGTPAPEAVDTPI